MTYCMFLQCYNFRTFYIPIMYIYTLNTLSYNEKNSSVCFLIVINSCKKRKENSVKCIFGSCFIHSL